MPLNMCIGSLATISRKCGKRSEKENREREFAMRIKLIEIPYRQLYKNKVFGLIGYKQDL